MWLLHPPHTRKKNECIAERWNNSNQIVSKFLFISFLLLTFYFLQPNLFTQYSMCAPFQVHIVHDLFIICIACIDHCMSWHQELIKFHFKFESNKNHQRRYGDDVREIMGNETTTTNRPSHQQNNFLWNVRLCLFSFYRNFSCCWYFSFVILRCCVTAHMFAFIHYVWF